MLCSVGMTNGVLRLIARYGDADTKARFLDKLMCNDFDQGWDGVDVPYRERRWLRPRRHRTVATLVDGVWKLTGSKWFCSNVDGKAIVTLARPEGAPAGIKGSRCSPSSARCQTVLKTACTSAASRQAWHAPCRPARLISSTPPLTCCVVTVRHWMGSASTA